MNARIALITGGNRGLGRASALALAEAGTDVVLTYRSNRDEAAAVVAEIESRGRRAAALRLDTTEFASFDAFVDSLRTVLDETWQRETFDHVVNNAGIAATTPLGETAPETLDTLFAVHFKGVFLLTQALVPLLADGGRILNTSTGLARFTGPGYSAYGSMKGAVEVLTRYWAQAGSPSTSSRPARSPPTSAAATCATTPRCARRWGRGPRSAGSASRTTSGR
jgi:NAD(P)-dependent dehydrogenase (short-subunit alcohol dehydrogenase family)